MISCKNSQKKLSCRGTQTRHEVIASCNPLVSNLALLLTSLRRVTRHWRQHQGEGEVEASDRISFYMDARTSTRREGWQSGSGEFLTNAGKVFHTCTDAVEDGVMTNGMDWRYCLRVTEQGEAIFYLATRQVFVEFASQTRSRS